MPEQQPPKFWRSKVGIVWAGFLAVAGFFLVTEHTAHLLGILPWLLLAACPVMFLFMDHGHGGDRHSADHTDDGDHKPDGQRGESR